MLARAITDWNMSLSRDMTRGDYEARYGKSFKGGERIDGVIVGGNVALADPCPSV